jgi:hypothetical protein
MLQSRSVIVQLLAIALLLGSSAGRGVARASGAALSPQGAAGLSVQSTPSTDAQVTLSSAEVTTSWDSRLHEPEPFPLPVLHLQRGRRPTAAGERTLTLHLSGLAGGRVVELEIASRHSNPTTGVQHRESSRFSLPDRPCTASEPCTLQWTLDAATTLSDYYRLTLRDVEGRLLWENPDPGRPDLVALDTWEVDVEEHTVLITYAALFPYARGEVHFDERLAPEAVHAFIGDQFVPIVRETWETQFGSWGYGPTHPDWDRDRVVEVFFTSAPYALYDGTGTYTVSAYADGRPYPERRIWLSTEDAVLERYGSLANGYRVMFSHEFHHLAQWNTGLSAGCPAPKWPKVLTESQATCAASLQYPDVELSTDHLVAGGSQYGATAKRLLERHLETSYADLEEHEGSQYDLALYWRFLYEQYGDMGVFRAALEEMACRPADDLPATLGEVMDAALDRVDGVFETHEDSLAAFAQANYALRLEDGRCTAADLSACGGRHYDPQDVYTAPMIDTRLHYRGSALLHDGSIPASYGTDTIEISMDPGLRGQPMTIAFRSEGARFSVQAWKLHPDGTGMRNPALGKTGIRARTPHPQPDRRLQRRMSLHHPAPEPGPVRPHRPDRGPPGSPRRIRSRRRLSPHRELGTMTLSECDQSDSGSLRSSASSSLAVPHRSRARPRSCAAAAASGGRAAPAAATRLPATSWIQRELVTTG